MRRQQRMLLNPELVSQLPDEFTMADMCRLFGVSKQQAYYWIRSEAMPVHDRGNRPSAIMKKDEFLQWATMVKRLYLP